MVDPCRSCAFWPTLTRPLDSTPTGPEPGPVFLARAVAAQQWWLVHDASVCCRGRWSVPVDKRNGGLRSGTYSVFWVPIARLTGLQHCMTSRSPPPSLSPARLRRHPILPSNLSFSISLTVPPSTPIARLGDATSLHRLDFHRRTTISLFLGFDSHRAQLDAILCGFHSVTTPTRAPRRLGGLEPTRRRKKSKAVAIRLHATGSSSKCNAQDCRLYHVDQS